MRKCDILAKLQERERESLHVCMQANVCAWTDVKDNSHKQTAYIITWTLIPNPAIFKVGLTYLL